MSGKDAMLIKAVKYQSKYDHGHVGEVSSINVKFLKSLLEKGDIPVISSIGVGEDGSTYNINADHVASAVATALTADKLMLMTDVDGVLDGEGKLIQRINKKSIDQLIASGVITGGMIPKVKSALDVVESGVKSVHIINGTVEHSILLEILTSQGVGTMVTVDEVSG
jgi:acetylglutamate kinase